MGPWAYTGTIGAHRGADVVFNFQWQVTTNNDGVNRNNANNNHLADEQIVMIQTLQAQMEELR